MRPWVGLGDLKNIILGGGPGLTRGMSPGLDLRCGGGNLTLGDSPLVPLAGPMYPIISMGRRAGRGPAPGCGSGGAPLSSGPAVRTFKDFETSKFDFCAMDLEASRAFCLVIFSSFLRRLMY